MKEVRKTAHQYIILPKNSSCKTYAKVNIVLENAPSKTYAQVTKETKSKLHSAENNDALLKNLTKLKKT